MNGRKHIHEEAFEVDETVFVLCAPPARFERVGRLAGSSSISRAFERASDTFPSGLEAYLSFTSYGR
jgi:hypothetical protein